MTKPRFLLALALLMCAAAPPASADSIPGLRGHDHTGITVPDVKEAILKQGSKAVSSKSPEEFARYIKSEAEKFYPVIQAAGLEGSQ